MKTKNILIGTLVLMVLIMFVIIVWPSPEVQPEVQYVVVTTTPTLVPPEPTMIPDCTWNNKYDVVEETGFDESRIQVTSSCENESTETFSKIYESRYYQVFLSNFNVDFTKHVFFVNQIRRVNDWPVSTREAIYPKAVVNSDLSVEGRYLLLSENTTPIDVEWVDLSNRVLFITRIEDLEIKAINELVAPLNAERSTKPESNYYQPQDNSPKCLAWRALGGNAFPGSADYSQCHSR